MTMRHLTQPGTGRRGLRRLTVTADESRAVMCRASPGLQADSSQIGTAVNQTVEVEPFAAARFRRRPIRATLSQESAGGVGLVQRTDPLRAMRRVASKLRPAAGR